MSGWRFYPLERETDVGILVSPERKPRPAIFLTPENAKARAQKERLGFA